MVERESIMSHVLSDSALLFSNRSNKQSDETTLSDGISRTLTREGLLFALCASTIGTGIAATPMTYKLAGFWGGILLSLLGAIFSWLGVYALKVCTMNTKATSFEAIGQEAFGFGFLRYFFCEASLAGILFLVCCIYIVLGASGLITVLENFNVNLSPFIKNYGVKFFVTTSIASISLLRSYENLKFTSAYCLFAYSITALVIGGKTFFMKRLEDAKPVQITASSLLVAWAQIALSYLCQFNIPALYSELTKKSKPFFDSFSGIALVITWVAFAIAGVFPYFVYGDKVEDNILVQLGRDFPDSKIINIASLLLLSTAILSCPLYCFPLKSLALGMRNTNMADCSNTENYIITFGIMYSTLIFSILIPNLGLLVQIGGATFGVITMAVAPGAFIIKLGKDNKEKYLGYFLVVYGTVCVSMCVFSIYLVYS